MKSLSIDPSITATGWVLIKESNNTYKLLDSGVEKVGVCGKSKTDNKFQKQRYYSFFIYELLKKNQPDVVYVEYPHGSQSYTAAWALSMCTSIITSMCISLSILCYPVLESRVKKCVHGKSKNVSKEMTREKMIDFYKKIGYIESQFKYKAEAIADALAVYTYFRFNKLDGGL